MKYSLSAEISGVCDQYSLSEFAAAFRSPRIQTVHKLIDKKINASSYSPNNNCDDFGKFWKQSITKLRGHICFVSNEYNNDKQF